MSRGNALGRSGIAAAVLALCAVPASAQLAKCVIHGPAADKIEDQSEISLDTAKQIVGNLLIQNAIEDAKKAVTEGESLATTLKKSGQFPPTMIHMTAVGERAGQLEQMLERVALTYETEVDTKLSRFTALLEPMMLVLMGGAVAFIVF